MIRKQIRKILILFLLALSLLPVHAENAYQLEVDLVSQYAYVIDLTNNEVLLDIQSKEKMYPASMTKIMTAIVAIENASSLNETIYMDENVFDGLVEANATVAGYAVGDEATINDLLYGVALPSGADACNALALHTSGSIDNFVKLMNEKAIELGMKQTHFQNPTGLHDANHYTTAYDIATLLTYCIKNDTFKKVFSTRRYITAPVASHPNGIDLISTVENALDISDVPLPGLGGAKTGFTFEAGHCIAYWANNGEFDVVGVTGLADTSMYEMTHVEDMSRTLLELQNWHHKTLSSEGELLHTITVHHRYEDETIELYVPATVAMDLRDDYEIQTVFNMPDEITSTNEEQTLDGLYSILVDGIAVYEKGLHVTIPREPNFFGRFLNWFDDLIH